MRALVSIIKGGENGNDILGKVHVHRRRHDAVVPRIQPVT